MYGRVLQIREAIQKMGASLPDELLLTLNERIKCREIQIQQLTCLLNPDYPSPSVLCIHGVEATGKSLTVSALLEGLSTPSAIVRSRECITTRHLLERTITAVRDALKQSLHEDELPSIDGRCESISAFAVHLQNLLAPRRKFILVFDGIDRQREAAPTLLPALARLDEIIPTLTTIFIVRSLQPRLLHRAGIPHIHFTPYTRAQMLEILSTTPLPIPTTTTTNNPSSPSPDPDQSWLWTRFCTAVWDSLGQSAARDVLSFRRACSRLWGPFTQPIQAGQYNPREFSKLMVRNRGLFQSEAAVTERILTLPPPDPLISSAATKAKTATLPAPTLPLPHTTTHLLLAAYLAASNPPRTDLTFFSKSSSFSRRRKRKRKPHSTHAPHSHNTTRRHRRLLAPQSFPLERWLAIFHAVRDDDTGGNWNGDGMLGCQIATLSRLGLVIQTGAAGAAGEMLGGGGKWKVGPGVGLDVIRGLARGVGVLVEDYLAE